MNFLGLLFSRPTIYFSTRFYTLQTNDLDYGERKNFSGGRFWANRS